MVAYSGIAALPIRQGNTDPPDLSASTSEQALKLDPRVVAYFATTTARDAAYTDAIAGTGSYTAAALTGMRCYVQNGPGGYPDWCGWNGVEWLWDHPVPLTYNSGSISGTSVTYTALTGHNPSVWAINPVRSGFAEIRIAVACSSGAPGFGSGYLRARYSSGTLLPGGNGFTVIEESAAGTRRDTIQHYPIPIWLSKGVTTTLAFDLASFAIGGGAYWSLASAQWLITQT